VSDWRLSPTMKRVLARIRRRGELGVLPNKVPFRTTLALVRRGLVHYVPTLHGMVYYAEPKPKDGP
jgi:phosphoglycolate phosphatase-like HAD superfamily hydrolase